MIERVLYSLTHPVASSQVNTVASASSLSTLQSSLSYVGFGLLFILSIVGIFAIIRFNKSKFIKNSCWQVLVIWWLISIGLLGIFELIPWTIIGESPIRFRTMEFSYFGIVPFSAIGIQAIVSISNHWKRRSLKRMIRVASIISVILIAIPTIVVGFSNYLYDNPPVTDMSHLNSVESYYASIWLSKHNSTGFVAGTQDGTVFVSGYAAMNFSYDKLVTTFKIHEIIADTYFLNLANIRLPDQGNFKIDQGNLTWLDSNCNKVYDNGQLIILTANVHFK